MYAESLLSSSRSDRGRVPLSRARASRDRPPESAPPRIMRPRRVSRAALALALVSALASLGVARGDRSASTVGAGGSRSDEATRASPSPGPHQGAPLPPFPTEADTAFAAWLASKGGAFTGAGVWSYVETGHATGDPSIVTGRNRGVFAKDAPVENGDVLVEMRLDAALTVPSERAGSILNAVARQVDPEWALAMLLLRESNLGPSGPYAPFLRMALGVESDAATRPEGATDDVRATALTNDAVAALNGTFAGAYHDALVRKDRVTFSRVRAMTTGTFPAAFPERLFGDFSRVAKALATVREKGARFPVAYRDSRTFETAAALVPIAHALPHDPRGAEPCVGVVEEVSSDASDASRTSLKLVVRVAAGAPGEELRCNRGAASAVSAIESPSSRNSPPGTHEDKSADRSVFWSDASIGTNLSDDDGALFRFASAAATGALTDAEAAFRFGGVGVGRNARDAVALTLAEPSFSADDVALKAESDASGETQKRAAASRASLLARCGPEKARALTRDGPSDELWCAVRVATADDSEAVSLFRRLEEKDAEKDAADAATRGDEPRAAAAMLRDAPVSDAAEARALAALLETTAAILDGYPTSDARDEALLRRAARARGEEAFSKTENEEGEEDEEEDGQNLADDVAEAVRCRLREKRLLIDALNTLQRAASLTLTGGVRLDVVAGDGAAAESNAAKSNAAKSPPGGFEVRKAKYEKEL